MQTAQPPDTKSNQSGMRQADSKEDVLNKNGQNKDISQTETPQKNLHGVREISREEAERSIAPDQDPDDPVSP